MSESVGNCCSQMFAIMPRKSRNSLRMLSEVYSGASHLRSSFVGIGSYRRQPKTSRWAVCAQVKEPPAEGSFCGFPVACVAIHIRYCMTLSFRFKMIHMWEKYGMPFFVLGDRVVVDGDDGPIAAWRNMVVWPGVLSFSHSLSLSFSLSLSLSVYDMQ